MDREAIVSILPPQRNRGRNYLSQVLRREVRSSLCHFLNTQFTDSIFMLSKANEPNEERLSSIGINESWDYMVSGRTFKRINFPVEENTK